MIRLIGHLFAPDDRGLCAVTVSDGRIVSIEPTDAAAGSAARVTSGAAASDAGAGEAAAAPAVETFGGPSARILPGLLDIQLNGAFGDDFADPAADIASICRRLPRFGVTGFVPTIVTSEPEVYAPALANLRRPASPGEARVLGVHIEGPFLSPTYRGTHDPAQVRLPSIDEARGWLDAGDVRWFTLAPELPGAIDLISFLVERGVRVSMGHTDATWSDAAAAAEAGATMATHLFNAMRPLRHRDPGVAGYVLANGVIAGFIADGNHLAFDTIRLLARVKAPDELYLVTDALAGLGMPPGRYMLAGQEYVSDGTCGRRDDGTLSGSLLPLNLAVRNLVEHVGLDPALAVRLATRNPARAIGLDAELGAVEVGRAADLVVVDERWNVQATVAGGEVAYRSDAATAMAAQPVGRAEAAG